MGNLRFLLLAFLVTLTAAPLRAQTNSLESLVQGNNAFALDLYQQLKAEPGNLFFSPYSISSAMTLLYAGARGNTAAQLAHALHLGTNPTANVVAFKNLNLALQPVKNTNTDFDIANGLWGQTGHRFTAEYLKLAADDFEARLRQVNFKTQAEPARLEINQWVADKTHDKIKDLLPIGSLPKNSKLVIVNAIYFNGKWQSPFKTNHTASAPFYLTSGSTVPCPFMNQQEDCEFADLPDLQMVSLPYRTGTLDANAPRFSLVILLPKNPAGLPALESNLNASILNGWLANMRFQEVNIFLPKFQSSSSFSLSSTFKQLGVSNAFDEHADFSGIDGARNLYVSAIVHKAYVDMNEAGTEAAAATGITMTAGAMHRPPVVFRADHPFLYLIREQSTGQILFLGRFATP